MPELPEVETMVRGLRPALEGRAIRRLTVVDAHLLSNCEAPALEQQARGARVAAVNRRGKWVVIELAPPAVLLLDMMMPIMNGFEFREAQLRDPAIQQIPVIALSGVTDPAETATHLAANAYVHKPTEARKIVALVRQHCLKADGAETT